MKTILVCLMNSATAGAVMRAAVSLARAHGSHVIGLHTLEAIVIYPGIAIHIPQEAVHAISDSQQQEAAKIEAIFHEHTEGEDFASEWRLLKSAGMSAADRLVESARISDLVIMPSVDEERARADQHHAQARLIRESGRPVLLIPEDFEGGALGKNIVLGWSDTKKAARAAHDCIALAGPEGRVSVVRVGSGVADEMNDYTSVDLAAMFARHGIESSVVHLEFDRGREDIPDALQRYAFEQGADLIATGAFGHSRVYDFVVGAVTSNLLRSARMPVLFSG